MFASVVELNCSVFILKYQQVYNFISSMKTTRQCHATRYSNEPSAIISCMYCNSPAAVWWQLASTVKLNCPSVMLITHYRNPVGCSSAGTNVCSGLSAPSLGCFFNKCLRFSEIGAGSEPALNVIRVPTFSVKHFAPPLRSPSPRTFFFPTGGFGEPQCYHSLILFESGRVQAGKGAKRASWVVRGETL